MRDLMTVMQELNDSDDAMEAAAKKLCVRRGYDPMELEQYPDPNGYAVLRKRPRWKGVYEELQEAATTLLCLTEG